MVTDDPNISSISEEVNKSSLDDSNNNNSSSNNTTTAYSDTNSISTYSYFNSNASVISYDSILTNDRLLDKLDLSQDDKILLQNVLEEEKRQETQSTNQQENDSRIICVPASQFPSLKVKQLPNDSLTNNNSRDSIRQLLEKDFTFKDKSLAAQVEQHYASTSRYSYIVEEDYDDDFLNPLSNKNSNADANANVNQNNTTTASTSTSSNPPRHIVMSNNYNFNNVDAQNRFNKIYSKQGRNSMTQPTQFNNNIRSKQQGNQRLSTNYPNTTNYSTSIKTNPTNNRLPNRNYNYNTNNSHHQSIPNFERFRLDNSILSKQNPPLNNSQNYSKFYNNNSTSNTSSNGISHNRRHSKEQYKYPGEDSNYDTSNGRFTHDKYQFQSVNDKFNKCQTPNSDSNMTVSSNASNKVDIGVAAKLYSGKVDSELPGAYMSKNRSTFTTPMNSIVNDKSTEYVNLITTPQKASRTGDDSQDTSSVVPLEKPISQKSHKKKSSLSSFKSLFKTPKSKKSHNSKEDLNSKSKSRSENSTKVKDFPRKDSSSSLDLTSSNSSVENSPSLGKSNLRKFIFPPNPSLHLDSKASHNKNGNIMYKDNHYRSLSDMNKPRIPKATTGSTSLQSSPSRVRKHKHSISTLSGEATIYLDNSKIIDLESHKISTGLSNVSSQDNDITNGDNNVRSSSPISLSNSLKENILMTPSNDLSQGDNHNSKGSCESTGSTIHGGHENQNTNTLITSAINMRIEGKLEASALKLKKACEAGNTTAFLLYGLALRHGCGTLEDQKLSLAYIKKATGIKSFDDEVYNRDINPLILEENNSIPTKLQEPLVPALHECGISYLKGYGGEEADELKGLKFLEKAASLNHVDSMCLCGIIWSQKSENRKKDISRAAAWFRLADKRGANLIGSDWIYKKKYTKGRLA
ncbi:similar to Saccharomyces cerevisiae YBR007C DSF2 Deletion suppressor of mpt5 mutation [Maudiozyma barnettii]|uniref:Similar to Saccharomyces cerevisiae YBR007C DSF2 Deletion suppressor of mpt5 mutation n=1 Tax=Maudiozyma barnettii TaxID=61262 RepID=A0A8H2VHD9_9SACH|nr:Dsf2p [Kazachstania barnettii]CAB4255254.1 similar to Saccharomyces cerevisiae YBR007C DSF2 Deletion suppressor of mpt5 mutation [Kazachstania barnettii]CAD1783661.1 similar to Saccharomyces cerevisiae YBR007C DSF2 Deletion suppressor of mpt5 mutation [Kazachstania barnettii]